MKKYLNSVSIFHLLALSLLTRIVAYYFYGDSELSNEWEKIVHNKEVSVIFGYYVAESEYIAHPKLAEIGDKVLPTIFMPPLYYYFIFVTKYFTSNVVVFNYLIIVLQIFLSLFSILIFFKILSNILRKDLSIIITFIFAFFPINILAATQISSVTLQIFLLLNFLFFLQELLIKKKKISILFFSIFSGLLILTRGEFFLFYFITIFYFFVFLNKDFKSFLTSIIITFIIISPYLQRNYSLFNTITLTKSFGYNLLKGNNPSLIVEGDAVYIENTFPRNNLNIKTNNQYEVNLDNFYKTKAIENIKEDPIKYFKFYFIKMISFLFLDINSSYSNYYNFFHIFPKIVLSMTSFIGALVLLRKKGFFQYLSVFYFSNILLFSIFFILPRYSLILLPIQLFLSIDVIKYLFRKLLN